MQCQDRRLASVNLPSLCTPVSLEQTWQLTFWHQRAIFDKLAQIGLRLAMCFSHAVTDCITHADVLDMSTGVFAFRMLVCQFRRELMFGDIFDFWERLWAAERLADCQLKVCELNQIASCECSSICIMCSCHSTHCNVCSHCLKE